MGNILLIGMGGFLGAILRYWLSGRVQELSGSISYPYGTLVVNISGCFMLGVLTWLVEARGFFTPELRSLLFVGLLGAFTTYSTFSLETLNLFTVGDTPRAFLNIASSVVLGLAAVWAGRFLPLLVWR